MYAHVGLFFKSSGVAENIFGNMKKRFSKKRLAVKKAKRSGAGRTDVAQLEEE